MTTSFYIDVQDAYKIRFGCSAYARKEAEINFPMESVPSPNNIGLTRIAKIVSISRVQLV
jgi:hypothetical protein